MVKILLAALSICLVILPSCTTTTTVNINGTSLKSHKYEPFNFMDYKGRMLPDFSKDDGTGAIVTFLFTTCTDVCPLSIHKIKNAVNASKYPTLPVIVFSVDPEGDSEEAIGNFFEKWDLEPNWYFVTGDREMLAKVWREFYVSPIKTKIPQPKNILTVKMEEKYRVSHTIPVFILDATGKARIVHSKVENEAALASDINTVGKMETR